MDDQVVFMEGTIYENGYGLLAKKVMKDRNLKHQAKVIYAYICSFASASNSSERIAFPRVATQIKDLGMSEDTYYKHRKSLVDRGFLKIDQAKGENGKFKHNIYKICPIVLDFEPTPENLGTEKPTPKNSGSANSSPRDLGTISNISISNTNISNSSLKNDDDDEEQKERERIADEFNVKALQDVIDKFEEEYPNQFDIYFWEKVFEQMVLQRVDIITYHEAIQQLEYMSEMIDQGKKIGDYHAYFIGGILRKRTSIDSALNNKKLFVPKSKPKKKAKQQVDPQENVTEYKKVEKSEDWAAKFKALETKLKK